MIIILRWNYLIERETFTPALCTSMDGLRALLVEWFSNGRHFELRFNDIVYHEADCNIGYAHFALYNYYAHYRLQLDGLRL